MNSRLMLVIISIIFLQSCADSSKDAESDLTPQEVLAQALVGDWIDTDCFRDGASEIFMQQKRFRFFANGTYEYHDSLYEQADTQCEGRPIARNVEAGTFGIGNEIRTSNTQSVAYEIDFAVTGFNYLGNSLMGESALNEDDSQRLYTIINVNGDDMSFEDFRAHDPGSRPLEFGDVYTKAALPANHNDFIATPNYTPATPSELLGQWQGWCFWIADGKYGDWYYNFTSVSTMQMKETVYSDSFCSVEVGSRTYSITYTATDIVTTSNISAVEAAGVSMTINSSVVSGDPSGLQNYADNTVLKEAMIVDSNYNVILESQGTTQGSQAYPNFIGRIYRRI